MRKLIVLSIIAVLALGCVVPAFAEVTQAQKTVTLMTSNGQSNHAVSSTVVKFHCQLLGVGARVLQDEVSATTKVFATVEPLNLSTGKVQVTLRTIPQSLGASFEFVSYDVVVQGTCLVPDAE